MFEFPEYSDRIQKLVDKRSWANHGHQRINAERTIIYTDYYKSHPNEYPILKRAGCIYDWCAKHQPLVMDEDILVGSLGPDYRSLSFYVEWITTWLDMCVNDDDDKFKEAWQTPGAVQMSDEERVKLQEAVEFWKVNNIPAKFEGILPEEVWGLADNGCNNTSPKNGFIQMGAKPQGHYIANFNKAVNLGFGAVKADAQTKIDEMKGRTFGDNVRKYLFYQAVIRVCDGAMLLSKRYGAECRKKAETAPTEERRAELLRMADSLEWIMEHPARTYWEGLQAMLLYQMILSTDAQQHGESFGRIDMYCGHLLEKELREGTITKEQAQEYTDAFILRAADFLCLDFGVPNDNIIELNKKGKSLYNVLGQHMTLTSGLHLTVGGQNMDGTDSTNEMTRLVITAYGHLNSPDPTSAVRIHSGTPDDIWEMAIESSKIAGGMPQFQNDDVIIPMLMRRGLSIADARNYSIVGCVEPAGTGCEWPACGNSGQESIWSLVGAVVFAINGGVNPKNGTTGRPCKKLYEYNNFGEFMAEVKAQAEYYLDWEVTICNFYEQMYSENFPCISASVMMDGCMESGKDATWGGCKYNSTGVTCIGIANVADSLMAIKKLVFDDKTVSARELYDALLANWEGYEHLRQVIINEVPHYGNDNAEVDELANWGMGVFAHHLRECEGPRGKYCGGTFTMTAHLYYGGVTPATPDGRGDGEPLADAISPRQGFDKNGPTAYLRSAAKLPQKDLFNGDQLNIRFSPTSVQGEEGTNKLRQLIQTYFDLDGMQVQFNVVSTEQLHKAQKNPDDYQNLVVRIAGFSAYFVELNRDMQDDFITRTEQSL